MAAGRQLGRVSEGAAIGSERIYDVAVIGGGIVGLATAMALTHRPGLALILLEAEERIAAHQTSHNSGVIHSGLYYKPGSLKARLCVEGRQELYSFCEEHGIPHERCGKVVVAARADEVPRLDALEQRGCANGLQGVRRLGPEEIREHEPHARGIQGLFVPDTGIVDFEAVAAAYAAEVRRRGGTIEFERRFQHCTRRDSELVLTTSRGELRCRHLVACAGLYADRVARACGVDPGVRIVAFRGEYWTLVPERQHLVRHLLYPVPDPRFPFLGVHFTRLVGGGIEAGPNAVLAWKREGYGRRSFSWRDAAEWLAYSGFWHLARRHWRMGLGEAWRSHSGHAFTAALQKLVPELRPGDLRRAGAGVRAMAVGTNGALLDDFHLVEAAGMLHVLNAPSPAATASIAIGRFIAARALELFDLSPASS